MNCDNKVAFIICANDDTLLNECILYLNRLEVPEGYQVECIVVKDAKSMLAGMTEGRDATDAKYKVYMHQDVFIINTKFIYDFLSVFESDSRIGLIGMVGSKKMPSNLCMWYGEREYYLYPYTNRGNVDYKNYSFKKEHGIADVIAVDGFLMITAYDIDFKIQLFDGWDFYDVSTSLEFLKLGYRVVVPNQKLPWCVHDDGVVMSLWNYDKYREKAIEEYGEFLSSNNYW